MNLNTVLTAGLQKLQSLNNGTLTYLSGSTTVSASVFKSYTKDYARDMQDAGYQESYDNMYVLAKPEDVSSWGLIPMQSNVELDGIPFQIGKSINKTANYWTVWLRYRT